MLDSRVAFMRRASAALLLSTASLWIACVILQQSQSQSQRSSSLNLRSLAALLPLRPIVYTYVVPIAVGVDVAVEMDPDHLSMPQNEQLQKQRQQQQQEADLLIWKTAWQSAGFDARILTQEDAKQHQAYSDYMEIIGSVIPYGHQEVKQGYLRYLAAAAAASGGSASYLADVSVLPLWPAAAFPKSPAFAVRCGSARKQPSGCLLSGSSGEWLRIAGALAESLQRRGAAAHDPGGDEPPAAPPIAWTDRDALQELCSLARGRPTIAHQESQTLTWRQALDSAAPVPRGNTRHSNNSNNRCWTHHLAIQIMPSSLQQQQQDEQEQLQSLGETASSALTPSLQQQDSWLQQWNRDCVHALHHKDLNYVSHSVI